MKKTSSFTLNFLKNGLIRAIVKTPAFPFVLQIISLGVVLWLVFNGLGIGLDMKQEELMTLRKTNLTTLVVWGLWWPGMVVAALLFGRMWCMVCPMELINRLGNGLSRKLGLQTRKMNRFLRAGWLTVLIYLALQLFVAGLSVHRIPSYTAILLLLLLGLSMISGIVFRDSRSFCKAFCPSAALLSVYGRFAPVQLEAVEQSVCRDCISKDCISASNRNRFDRKSCPSLLVPYHRNASDGCVMCLQCAKVCPNDNIGVGLVTAKAPIKQRTLLRPFEAAFVLIAIGFVFHEVTGEVEGVDHLFHLVPAKLQGLFPFVSAGWCEAFWFLLLFPILIWSAISAIARYSGHRAGIRSLLLAAATGAAPVVATAHIAKATAKITSWGGYLPLAVQDPHGVDTLNKLSQHVIFPPAGLLGLSAVGWIMLIATGVITSRLWHLDRDKFGASAIPARTGLIVSFVLFSFILMTWIWPTMC